MPTDFLIRIVTLNQARTRRGFSLLEMLTILVILGVLTTLGLSIFGRTAHAARRSALDQFTAAVEQARTSAITLRKPVLLAVAPPDEEAGGHDRKTRFGLFEVDSLPSASGTVQARQVQRWSTMPDGIIFLKGKVDGLRNLLDGDKTLLTWKDGENRATVYLLAFTPRGGLALPSGSDPVGIRLGTGIYQEGEPVSTKEGGASSLRIGRVVARPWRLDG